MPLYLICSPFPDPQTSEKVKPTNAALPITSVYPALCCSLTIFAFNSVILATEPLLVRLWFASSCLCGLNGRECVGLWGSGLGIPGQPTLPVTFRLRTEYKRKGKPLGTLRGECKTRPSPRCRTMDSPASAAGRDLLKGEVPFLHHTWPVSPSVTVTGMNDRHLANSGISVQNWRRRSHADKSVHHVIGSLYIWLESALFWAKSGKHPSSAKRSNKGTSTHRCMQTNPKRLLTDHLFIS